jgi:uncharacterized protein (DUF427 family)
MARAVWNGAVIAESDAIVEVDGNHSFPSASADRTLLRGSGTDTVCPSKGTASYYDVVVGDQVNADAAWQYPTPGDAAVNITDYVAFWRGVSVRGDAGVATPTAVVRVGSGRRSLKISMS